MVSGIRFMACSGAMGNTVASLYANGMATIQLEIFNYEIGADSSPNRLGFFGSAGAPNSAVVVGQYQDRTHVTDVNGNDLGQMINCKYTGASTVSHSGVPFTAGFAEIPRESGTLLCRFTEPNGTAVVTQTATFKAVNFDAGGGVPDTTDAALATDITVQAAQLEDTAGNAADSTWTQISSGGSALALADQNMLAHVHDFHLLVSGSPSVAGKKSDFGYYIQLEFL